MEILHINLKFAIGNGKYKIMKSLFARNCWQSYVFRTQTRTVQMWGMQQEYRQTSIHFTWTIVCIIFICQYVFTNASALVTLKVKIKYLIDF